MCRQRPVIIKSSTVICTISEADIFSKVRRTQKGIKLALTERWYSWEDAWKVAQDDPEVDLTADTGTAAYKPTMLEVRSIVKPL